VVPTFDIAAALTSLDLAEERDNPDTAWLQASWDAPDAFWKALSAHVARSTGPLRSRPGVAYDIYSDAVLRHARSDRIAYLRYDRFAGFQSLSFAGLDDRAANLAAAWTAAGAKPGACIALVLPPGLDALITLVAGLRLGALVSFVVPQGDLSLAPRLKALKPAHVVFDPEWKPAGLGDLAEKALPLKTTARAPAVPPHGYAHGEPCLKLLPWTREPPEKPALVLAETAYLRPLRDGALAFRLAPGDRLAAPGVHPAQHFPALWLTTLLHGATFVDIPLDEIEKSTALLRAQPIHSLGVCSALAGALQNSPIERPAALRHVWRPADEPLDWPARRDFIESNGLEQVRFSNVLVDAAAGGCVLFSACRPGSSNAKVLPSAGAPWGLFAPGKNEAAPGDAGVLVPLPSKKPQEDGWFVIARVATDYLYGGPVLPRRAGRVFPAVELAAAIATLPFVRGAAVVPLAGAGPSGITLFVLVVFLGARAPHPSFSAQIQALVAERLGPDFAPDLVELFPLYPRLKDGAVDSDWCAAHYIAGRLHKKSEAPAFGRLAALRKALLETGEAAPKAAV
jgi:hypothetical protein